MTFPYKLPLQVVISTITILKLSTLKTEQNNFMFNWNFFNFNNTTLNRISLSLKQPLKDVNAKAVIERCSGNKMFLKLMGNWLKHMQDFWKIPVKKVLFSKFAGFTKKWTMNSYNGNFQEFLRTSFSRTVINGLLHK